MNQQDNGRKSKKKKKKLDYPTEMWPRIHITQYCDVCSKWEKLKRDTHYNKCNPLVVAF